jgi:predicted small lipoprotein YifL
MMRRSSCLYMAIALLSSLAACGPGEPESAPEATEVAPEAATVSSVIDIEATNYAFTAPPRFPSGWVTLRFDNLAPETHFMLLWRLPEGKTFGDYASEISQPFSRLYKEYRAGALAQAEFFEQLGAELPEWFGTTRRMGGPGFTAPGRTSQTTVFLEPGEYVMECYVRAEAEEDTFHSEQGMLRPLIVTETVAAEAPPEADMEITLSNYELSVEGQPSAGEHTVRVRVEEDPEGLILHNVHLAKLDEGTSAEEVTRWLDWVDAMLPPAPAEFLGGAGQILAGNESYFTVNLEPGRYAWVSETWGIRGMIHEFIVE